MRMLIVRKARLLLVFAFPLLGFLWFFMNVMQHQLPRYHPIDFGWKMSSYNGSDTVTEKYVPDKSREVLETEQVQRRRLVREVCKISDRQLSLDEVLEDKEMLDHIIVDDEHRLLYCYVPKVACTNWKRLLMVLMKKANTTDPLAIVADDSHRTHVFRRLNNYTSEEIRYRLDHFMKFLFVRHPFERLVSAYRNKFSQNYSSSEYFRSRYGRQIIKQYRTNASEESLAKGHDVTFAEFIRYVIDPKTVAHNVFNEHWRPMVDLCLPCTIQYNVIGKYDTLMDDAWLVLDNVKLSHIASFPRSDKPSSTSSLMNEYAGQLTKEQLMHLYHIYEMDFRLFDYQQEGFD